MELTIENRRSNGWIHSLKLVLMLILIYDTVYYIEKSFNFFTIFTAGTLLFRIEL